MTAPSHINGNSSPGTVVVLEFPDEAQSYLGQCHRQGLDPSQAQVISLNPNVQVWLQRNGIRCVNSLPYFTSNSHARALRKSHQLLGWLESRVTLQDGLGVKDAYTNGFIWYCRYTLHHLLYLAEILSEAHLHHPDTGFQASAVLASGSGTPFVLDGDRYLGALAEEYCREQGIPFQSIDIRSPAAPATASVSRRRGIAGLGYKLGARLHWAALRRMGRNRPLLALSRSYRFDSLVEQASHELPELPWAVRGELTGSPRGMELLRRAVRAVIPKGGKDNNGLYIGEYWLRVLERGASEEPAFVEQLDNIFAQITGEVEKESELFSHRGVPFGTYFANKLRTGIRSGMEMVHREVLAHDQMLAVLRPRLLVTPFGRRSYEALGDLSRRRGVPGLLISHGSFPPAKNDLEKIAWDIHSYGMLHGSYSHAALQTPLAEAFTNQVSTSAQFCRTGPLVWGRQVDRTRSAEVRANLVPGQADCRIVVHAGTPKTRIGTHFHVYETPDEYVAGIKELILAANQVPNTFLIIKFRPKSFGVHELRELLPTSDRYTISVEEPFLDVLGIADLLVSFSSTTIEEALQNRVPVLLYGGDGRYQHIEAAEVSPDKEIKPGAVYHVKQPEHLTGALGQILDINGRAPLPEELFQPYIYKQEEVTSFPDLVRQLVQT